jgi:5-methylcytosine-specific restriction endonuclease McrA
VSLVGVSERGNERDKEGEEARDKREKKRKEEIGPEWTRTHDDETATNSV